MECEETTSIAIDCFATCKCLLNDSNGNQIFELLKKYIYLHSTLLEEHNLREKVDSIINQIIEKIKNSHPEYGKED